jgi:predicted TIM-barrel fold metal-dependent hydrolase
MTYAGNRRIVDADSHLMEWPGFLTDNAEPSLRDRMPAIVGGASRLVPRAAGHDGEAKAALIALGDDLLRRGPKWYDALGAVDPHDRIAALDLLGFERQVIYSSLCAPLFDLPDPALRYGAYRAHNRAMAGYCAADPRLLGVALCDLDDPDAALVEINFALDAGLRLLWIPARAPGGRAPGHAALDRIWATLAERGVPFVLHVGSGPLPIGAAWNDNGRPKPEGMAGAEIISARDFQVVHHTHARFLAALVLDGVLERHPRLHGGAIEVGAGWVPDLLRRLDHAVEIWQRSEADLRAFTRKPSEQAIEQLRFTPYPFEDVGAFIRESDPRLYLFSSDYPHAEGGRDPLKRFDGSLQSAASAVRAGFFADNAAHWLGIA